MPIIKYSYKTTHKCDTRQTNLWKNILIYETFAHLFHRHVCCRNVARQRAQQRHCQLCCAHCVATWCIHDHHAVSGSEKWNAWSQEHVKKNKGYIKCDRSVQNETKILWTSILLLVKHTWWPLSRQCCRFPHQRDQWCASSWQIEWL